MHCICQYTMFVHVYCAIASSKEEEIIGWHAAWTTQKGTVISHNIKERHLLFGFCDKVHNAENLFIRGYKAQSLLWLVDGRCASKIFREALFTHQLKTAQTKDWSQDLRIEILNIKRNTWMILVTLQ